MEKRSAAIDSFRRYLSAIFLAALTAGMISLFYFYHLLLLESPRAPNASLGLTHAISSHGSHFYVDAASSTLLACLEGLILSTLLLLAVAIPKDKHLPKIYLGRKHNIVGVTCFLGCLGLLLAGGPAIAGMLAAHGVTLDPFGS